MATVQSIKQNIKGHVQEAVGTVEKKAGQPVKGTIDQMKGKANQTVAGLKDKLQEAKK